MLVLLILIFLPLLEISGFIIIGGKIGIGLSLLWIIVDAIAGFMLLTTLGGQTLRKAQKSTTADAYPFEEMFDGFCIIIGALLLIFPGFFSDFMALPLLLPPVRSWLFKFLKEQHSGFFDNLGKSSQGFTSWYYEERGPRGSKTIEGEFTSRDDTKNLE